MPLYPMIDDRDMESSWNDRSISWNTKRNHAAWKLYLSKLTGEIPAYAAPARQTDFTGLPPAGIYFCCMGIAVARHPERYSEKVRRLFYKDGCLH